MLKKLGVLKRKIKRTRVPALRFDQSRERHKVSGGAHCIESSWVKDCYTKGNSSKEMLIKDVFKVDLSPLMKCYTSLRVGDGQEREWSRCMTPVTSLF